MKTSLCADRGASGGFASDDATEVYSERIAGSDSSGATSMAKGIPDPEGPRTQTMGFYQVRILRIV